MLTYYSFLVSKHFLLHCLMLALKCQGSTGIEMQDFCLFVASVGRTGVLEKLSWRSTHFRRCFLSSILAGILLVTLSSLASRPLTRCDQFFEMDANPFRKLEKKTVDTMFKRFHHVWQKQFTTLLGIKLQS